MDQPQDESPDIDGDFNSVRSNLIVGGGLPKIRGIGSVFENNTIVTNHAPPVPEIVQRLQQEALFLMRSHYSALHPDAPEDGTFPPEDFLNAELASIQSFWRVRLSDDRKQAVSYPALNTPPAKPPNL